MLKSLLTAIAVVAVTAPTSHAIEFVNQDGSQLSELCIVAAESNSNTINRAEAASVLCNGMPLRSFVKQYRATTRVVALEQANNTPESQLCVAAATSNEAFAQAKANFEAAAINDVACNGVKLAKFAKRYNRQFNG